MKVRIKGIKDLERFSELHKIKEVHISQRPSKRDLFELTRKLPNLKRIWVPPSIYSLLPKNLDVNVAISVSREKRGRPKKYGEEQIKQILEARRKGVNAREISKKLGIPLRTVYYYLENNGRTSEKTF